MKTALKTAQILIGMLLIPATLLSQQPGQFTDAEWPCFRRDLLNTGISNLKGGLTEIEEIWNFSLGGSLNSAQMKDVNEDGFDEIFVINAGKIVAYDQNVSLMWESPILNITYILDIIDLDNNGTQDLICASSQPPVIYILGAQTGAIQWQHKFQPADRTLAPGCIKIGDIDGSNDGKLELFCWPWSGSKNGYAFEFKNGVASGTVVWEAFAEETWSYIPQVMVADMDADSIPEVVIGTYAHIYAWQGDNGDQKINFHFTTGGSYGRNYGIIKLKNIDSDPYPEIAVLAHSLNEHLTMIDNSGPEGNTIQLSVLWDKWFEYSYPEDHKDLRVSPNSVNDIDDDGEVELCCSVFNENGDNQWHLLIYNALTGDTEFDLSGYYLCDLQDLDGDSLAEVLCSQESSRAASRNNLNVLKGENNSYSIVSSKENVTPFFEYLPNLPLDVNGTSGTDVLFSRGVYFDNTTNLFCKEGSYLNIYQFKSDSLWKIWTSGPYQFSFSLLDAGKTGPDLFMNPLISLVNGHTLLLDIAGSEQANIQIGNFYTMPTTADLDSDGSIEVLIQDALGYMNVLDADDASLEKETDIQWRQPASGKTAKYGRNHTAYVDDINYDGYDEVFLRAGNSLLMFDHEGIKKRELTFESYPYEWVTGNFNGDSLKDLFVAFNTAGGHTNKIHVYNGNGDETPLWSKEYGPYSGYVAIFDFTRDSIDDVVLREHYDLVTLDGQDGRRYGFEPGAYYHTPIIMDTDLDGRHEIINGAGYLEVSVNRLYNQGNNISQIWEQATGYLDCYARMPGTADVDNDGHVEIGVSSTSGSFTCYDASNGETKWTIDLGTTASDIICLDADSDGRLEFVFGGKDGYLYILNGETDAPNRIAARIFLNAEVGSPIVTDFDGDDVAELLVTTYDGLLHCFRGIAPVAIESQRDSPQHFSLSQNYPNPFNARTIINYELPITNYVELTIYNVLGQKVATLVSRKQKAGFYKVKWDASGMASGVYYYRLVAGEYVDIKKFVLLK